MEETVRNFSVTTFRHGSGVDRFRDQGKMPPELASLKGYKLFDDVELLKVWRSNFKGIRWKDENGNELFGAVDNILVKGGKLVVLDYKTRGFALKEDTADTYQTQLDIYNFLLRKNDYETEGYAYLLFYIPKEVTETGEVIFDVQTVKMDVNPENGRAVFLNALKMLNEECPQDTCEWCERIK